MITQSELKKHLKYNPDTGIFTRLISIGMNVKVGDVAGSKNGKGYIDFRVNSTKQRANRMAFLYMTGSIPIQVDHINHVRDDDRWCNLRSASNSINQKNTSKRKDNKSGFTGVCWDKRHHKWCAQIGVNGKTIKIGRFSILGDAIKARKAANIKYDFHKNHGLSNV